MKIKHAIVTLLLISVLCNVVPAQNDIVPIIDLRINGLLGGSQNGKWIDAGIAAESIMNGAMDLNIFGFGGKEKATIPAARRGPVEDVCQDFFRIETGLKERPGTGLGINAAWTAMPRIPKRLSTRSQKYKKAVVSLLREQGVRRPVAKISQVFQIDLDHDGVDEILIAATYLKRRYGMGWKRGEYSIVMMIRKTRSGVRNYLVDGNIYKTPGDSDVAPSIFEISSIADLNGDGKMEVVIYSEYYEGAGSGVFEMLSGKLELIKELRIGCGL